MPWTCPACRQPIQHDRTERQPQAGILYRCHVCRLDLVYEGNQQKLTVVERSPESVPRQGAE